LEIWPIGGQFSCQLLAYDLDTQVVGKEGRKVSLRYRPKLYVWYFDKNSNKIKTQKRQNQTLKIFIQVISVNHHSGRKMKINVKT
jgi:hypothetical protein